MTPFFIVAGILAGFTIICFILSAVASQGNGNDREFANIFGGMGIGAGVSFLLLIAVTGNRQSSTMAATHTYITIKSVTIWESSHKYLYSTNYPGFQFSSDSAIYKPGDTVPLGYLHISKESK